MRKKFKIKKRSKKAMVMTWSNSHSNESETKGQKMTNLYFMGNGNFKREEDEECK